MQTTVCVIYEMCRIADYTESATGKIQNLKITFNSLLTLFISLSVNVIYSLSLIKQKNTLSNNFIVKILKAMHLRCKAQILF